MHGAPPVQMVCGSDRWWRLASCALTATAAAVTLLWLLAQTGMSERAAWVGPMAFVSLGSFCALRCTSGGQTSLLVWDGHAWTLDNRTGDVVIAIDLGPWMLLRFHDHARASVRWLPLPLHAVGAPDAVCRAALHAHAGAARTARDATGPRGRGG